MEYYLQVLTLAGINLMVVLGLGLLTGFTGLFSFGHAGFMCIGAYTSAILTVTLKVPFVVALIASGLVAGAISLLLGRLTLKLKGDYFLIATLGFGESVRLIFDNIEPLGGARGFSGIEKNSNFISVWLVCIIGIFFLIRLMNSRYGRNFKAIREEDASSPSVLMFSDRCSSSSVPSTPVSKPLYHYMTFIADDFQRSNQLSLLWPLSAVAPYGSVIALRLCCELLRLSLTGEWSSMELPSSSIIVRPKGIAGGKEFKDYFFVLWIRRLFKKILVKKDPGNGGKV